MKKKSQARRVNPNVYTKEYYLNDCSGYQEFKDSDGKKLENRFISTINCLKVKKGDKVLDVGGGRGELVFWSARQGAKSIGIDYAKSAIEIAQAARKKQSKTIQKLTTFKEMDAKKLEFADESFDWIIMTEVVEHLYPEELIKVMKEVKRVLKKDGKIFVHTAPSQIFNNYTYRFWCYPVSSFLVRLSNLITRGNYSNLMPWSKIRSKSHLIMHVNEPDYFSLKRTFDHVGLVGQIKSTNVTVIKPKLSWKDNLYNFLVYLYPISNFFPLNVIWGNDFLVILERKFLQSEKK